MLVMATLVFVSPVWADAPVVNPAACVAPSMHARVSAVIPSTLTMPRVYFRANGQGPEYYVDMHRGPNGSWWAMLPAIDSATKSIAYRVAGLDSTKHWVISNPISLPASAACPFQTLTSDEQLSAEHIVLGLTVANQPADPATGFTCRGVTNVIASNGQMRRAEKCRLAALTPVTPAATPAATAATANTAGKSIALKAAALAAGGFAAGYAIGHNNEKQISPSH
jgi:hypothetical protein